MRLLLPLRAGGGAAARRLSSSPAPALGNKLVMGSGSNVVDLFFPMRMLPKPGDKTYFANEVMVSETVVGGVTLNHLAWARALGVPTALMALQGADANGEVIRAKMRAMGVSTDFVRVSADYATSVSHILSGPDGERTILMAPASTSRLNGEAMRREFAEGVAARAAAVTTEVSQLPLSGVEWLLDAAAAAGAPSLLDVDVTPAVATGPARLGTLDELRRCVRKAGCLKLTASAAAELLALVSSKPLESRLENIAQQLADAFGSRLCVVTDGSRGSALALRSGGAARAEAVLVPVFGGVTQIDATGAGDAFFGGIVASVFHRGFPSSSQGLADAGAVAAAAGAACVEVVGALPTAVSAARIAGLCGIAAPFVAAASALDAAAAADPASAATAAKAPSSPALSGAVGAAAFGTSLRADGEAVAGVAARYAAGGARLDAAIAAAAALLGGARPGAAGARTAGGVVHCSGLGKSGAVASRLAMSLRSVGVRAGFVHGAEWAHGDLGGAGAGDVALLFSHSGGTAELVAAAQRLRARGAHVFAVTGCDGSSALARAAQHHLPAPARDDVRGAAVPARSIVAQEAVANALVSAAAEALTLTRETFVTNHPGGSIGSASK